MTETVRAQRLFVISTLWDLAETLKMAGESERSAHLAWVATALRDLDEGKVDPLLEPTKLSNKKPDAHSIWRGRIVVILGFDILQAADYSRNEAAAQVVKLVPDFSALRTGRKSGSDKEAVISWANRLRQRRELPDDIADLYDVGRQQIKGKAKLSKEAAMSAVRKLISDRATDLGVVFPAS